MPSRLAPRLDARRCGVRRSRRSTGPACPPRVAWRTAPHPELRRMGV